jgi:hypothetical protein
MQLVEQELLTLPEHMSPSSVFSGVRVTRSLVFMCMFCRSLFVLLYFFFWPLCWFTDSDYPFGIFILFLTFTEYLYYKWSQTCSVFYNHKPVFCLTCFLLDKFEDTNHKPYIEEEQTRQWTKENNDVQSITQKTKDLVTQTQLETGVNSSAPE